MKLFQSYSTVKLALTEKLVLSNQKAQTLLHSFISLHPQIYFSPPT